MRFLDQQDPPPPACIRDQVFNRDPASIRSFTVIIPLIVNVRSTWDKISCTDSYRDSPGAACVYVVSWAVSWWGDVLIARCRCPLLTTAVPYNHVNHSAISKIAENGAGAVFGDYSRQCGQGFIESTVNSGIDQQRINIAY